MSIRGLSTLPVRLQGSRPVARSFRTVGSGRSPDGAAAPITQPLPDLSENHPRRVVEVVHASDTGAVREAVFAANLQGVPLYPVSTGKNWGIGSRSPVADGCRLLDLSRMNQVRELDLARGIAVVEPGVTQGALAERLAGTPFMLNVTTSCRATSLVGNLLDNGQGVLRLRAEDLLGLEVVLGNGNIITTGAVAQPGHGARCERGAGPDATRLFCQSNFGVVTAAALALVPRPERTSFAYATFSGAALPAVVDCVARLRRERVIDHIFYFGEMQFEPGQRRRPDFTLLGPLLGRQRMVGEALDALGEALAAVPGCKALRTGEADELAPGDPLYHRGRTFLGIPSCEPVRKRFATTSCDLDRTSMRGWSVLQTLLPLEGSAASAGLALLQAGADAWALPVQPHLSSVSDRSLNLMTMIWFQRDADAIERMRGLRDQLRARLGEQGFEPSREGIDALRDARSSRPNDEAWARLKTAFDPNGIIAPGRYVALPGAQPAPRPQTRLAQALQ
jgi:4-cresol dehydrogenase (hydroxylating) flavoprotein subunit